MFSHWNRFYLQSTLGQTTKAHVEGEILHVRVQAGSYDSYSTHPFATVKLFYLLTWTSKLEQVQNGLLGNATNPNTLSVSCRNDWWLYKLQLRSSEHSICQVFWDIHMERDTFSSTDNEYGWAIKHFKFQSLLSRKPSNPAHNVIHLHRPLGTNSQNKQTNSWHDIMDGQGPCWLNSSVLSSAV